MLLPAGADEASVLAAAARAGVGLEGLAWHRHRAGGAPGLLMGYGGLTAPALRRAVGRIADALATAGGR